MPRTLENINIRKQYVKHYVMIKQLMIKIYRT
jgi:hypothetical protein